LFSYVKPLCPSLGFLNPLDSELKQVLTCIKMTI